MDGNKPMLNQDPQLIKVDAAAFGAKFSSKREIWRFLTCEVGAYLSTYQTMTIFHLRDLVARKRRMIKCPDVKVINVPHFEGLSIDDMLVFAEQYPEVMEAFPIVRHEVDKLPRAYIANVIHTLVGQPFAQFINKRANKRNEKVTKERSDRHGPLNCQNLHRQYCCQW